MKSGEEAIIQNKNEKLLGILRYFHFSS